MCCCVCVGGAVFFLYIMNCARLLYWSLRGQNMKVIGRKDFFGFQYICPLLSVMYPDLVDYDTYNIMHILSLSWFVQGYFLLRFLADQVGERQFVRFFRSFVKKYHGQLVLSQVSLSCGRRPVAQLKQQNISVGDPQLLERLLMNSQNKRADSEAPFSFP